MSEENKPVETTFESWDGDEREGLVNLMAMAITLVVASNPRIRSLAQQSAAHLRETHGLTEDKSREEVLLVQADALRLIARALKSGTDLYGGGEGVLSALGVVKGSEKGN